MVQSPTTQTALRAHRRQRREQSNLAPASTETTSRRAALDWYGFRDLHYPGSRRHKLEAIVAYGAYRKGSRSPGDGQERREASYPRAGGPTSAEATSLEEWEDEGGASL